MTIMDCKFSRTGLLLLLLLLSVQGLRAGKRFVTKMIYSNGSVYYDVNDKGEFAFLGMDASQGGRAQAYLWSEGKLRQLTDYQPSYAYSLFSIDINNNGQIVWTLYSAEGGGTARNILQFWDGQKLNTIRIDDLFWNQEIYPKLNDAGVIVWQAVPAYGVQPEIYRFAGGTVANISNSASNPDYVPGISNDGLVAWHGDNRNQNQWWNRIRYLKPGETSIAEIPDENASHPVTGENNLILYQKALSGFSVLKLFDGTSTKEIDDSVHTEGSASYAVSNGWIVYSKLNAAKNYDICRFGSNGIARMSEEGISNYHARVNREGTVVWSNAANEVLVNRQGEILKIGSGHQGVQPRISDQGLMVWAGGAITNYYNDMYICEYREVFDITGKVVLGNGDPLPDADFSVNGTAYGKTGADGTFKITDLDTGMVTITFNRTGYQFNPSQLSFRVSGNVEISPDVVATLNTFAKKINREPDFEIFPNPAAHMLAISFPNAPCGLCVLEIIHISGRVVYSGRHDFQALPDGLNINTKDFGKGQYIVRLNSGNKTCTKKLLVR